MEAIRAIQDGGVCVEMFRDDGFTIEEAQAEGEQIQSACKEKVASIRQGNEKLRKEYEDLGLSGQVQLLDEDAETLEAEAQAEARITPERVGFQKISPADMSIWKSFLPTEYKGDDLKKYSFDLIPQSVVTEWESAKLFGLFQDFSIRTIEGKSIWKRIEEKLQDPVLIGWFEEQPYLISRWGESLKSFSEIKMRVCVRRIFEPAITTLLIGLSLIVGTCLLYFQHLNADWISLFLCGCWFFFWSLLTEIVFLVIWRELYSLMQNKNFVDTWKHNLLYTCLAISSMVGVVIWIVALYKGLETVVTDFTPISLLCWLVFLTIASGSTIWLAREIKKA